MTDEITTPATPIDIVSVPVLESIPVTQAAESTPQALETVIENLGEDVAKETPSVIAHLEAFFEWDKEKLEEAIKWISAKL